MNHTHTLAANKNLYYLKLFTNIITVIFLFTLVGDGRPGNLKFLTEYKLGISSQIWPIMNQMNFKVDSPWKYSKHNKNDID